jgi:GNAT superfamily N-acetyltransferase
MAITLRAISTNDKDLYRETRLRALQDTPFAFGSNYAREAAFTDAEWQQRTANLASGHAVGYLALDAGLPCGLIAALPSEEFPNCFAVVSMWVAPTHRRLGVGTLLIDGIKDWAASRNARELRLMVTGNNPSAMDFYLRNGFDPTGHTGPYPNDPAVFEHEMLCALSAP